MSPRPKHVTSPGVKASQQQKIETPSKAPTRKLMKPLTTPTKDSAMNIEDAEVDVSAKSHSQKQRSDLADVIKV